MPLTIPPRTTRKQPFLYGMITGTFAAARTPMGDFQAEDLARTITKIVNRPADDSFCELLAELIVYTQDCEFRWEDGAPEEWRSFEPFWRQVKSGDLESAVLHYVTQVDNSVIAGVKNRSIGWYDAFIAAAKPYSPPKEWLAADKLTEAERKDPL